MATSKDSKFKLLNRNCKEKLKLKLIWDSLNNGTLNLGKNKTKKKAKENRLKMKKAMERVEKLLSKHEKLRENSHK